jgi:F-type H+-transporting ATPase subunit epsilon
MHVAEMSVDLVAVERRLWSGRATMLLARTIEGEIGILPRHIPLLGQLAEGHAVEIRTTDGETVRAAVHGGFISIGEQGVSILAESAELSDEIDVAAARAELDSDDEDTRTRAAGKLRAAGQTV